jgi:hypothetical protein
LAQCRGVSKSGTWRINLMVVMVPRDTHHDVQSLKNEWGGTAEYPDLGPDVDVAWCTFSCDTVALCIRVDSVVEELIKRPWTSVTLPAHMWPGGMCHLVSSVLDRLNIDDVCVTPHSCNTNM